MENLSKLGKNFDMSEEGKIFRWKRRSSPAFLSLTDRHVVHVHHLSPECVTAKIVNQKARTRSPIVAEDEEAVIHQLQHTTDAHCYVVPDTCTETPLASERSPSHIQSVDDFSVSTNETGRLHRSKSASTPSVIAADAKPLFVYPSTEEVEQSLPIVVPESTNCDEQQVPLNSVLRKSSKPDKTTAAPHLPMFMGHRPVATASLLTALSQNRPTKPTEENIEDQCTPQTQVKYREKPQLDSLTDRKAATNVSRRHSKIFSFLSKHEKHKKQKSDGDALAHAFISVSCSNSGVCDACSKPLAKTDVIQCSQCDVILHDACKMEVASCQRFKHPKAAKPLVPLHSRGSSVGDAPATSVTVTAVEETDNLNAAYNRRSISEFDQSWQQSPNAMDNGSLNQSCLSGASSLTGISNTLPSSLSHASQNASVEPGMFASTLPNSHLKPLRPPSIISEATLCSPSILARLPGNYLSDPKYQGIGLFKEDPEAWSLMVPKDVLKNMNIKDIKRQDIIHELIRTEKHHCRILVIMKQTYYYALCAIFANRATVDILMPALQELHDVHLEFFGKLRSRQMEAGARPDKQVDRIHDILFETFTGESGDLMEQAYVEFCSRKDQAVRNYQQLYQSNAAFQQTIKVTMSGPTFKDKTLPDCLTLIAQRLSKYHVLIEQIRKNTREETVESELMETAEAAVKGFIKKVNSGVEHQQMVAKVADITRKFDNKSTAYYKGQPFTHIELLSQSGRRILHIDNSVSCKSIRKDGPVMDLLVFDDVVVFLHYSKSGQSYGFAKLDDKLPVISLQGLLVREIAHNSRVGPKIYGLYLVSTDSKRPSDGNGHDPKQKKYQVSGDMYEIYCKGKKEFTKLQTVLNQAIREFRPSVPPSEPSFREEAQLHSADVEELQNLLRLNSEKDELLYRYFNEKLDSYRSLRSHLEKLPLKGNETACQQILELLEKNCDEIASGQSENLAGITNFLILDDAYNHVKQNMGSGDLLPRRAETFHGLKDLIQGSTKAKDRGIKKHNTVSGISDTQVNVPAMQKCDSHSGHLPTKHVYSADGLGSCKHITEKLLMHLSRLETEVQTLKSAKVNNSASTLNVDCSNEKKTPRRPSQEPQELYANQLETLRHLEAQVSAKKIEFERSCEAKRKDLDARETELAERESQVRQSEEEVCLKWIRLRQELDLMHSRGQPIAVSPPRLYAHGGQAGSVYSSFSNINQMCHCASAPVELSPGRGYNGSGGDVFDGEESAPLTEAVNPLLTSAAWQRQSVPEAVFPFSLRDSKRNVRYSASSVADVQSIASGIRTMYNKRPEVMLLPETQCSSVSSPGKCIQYSPSTSATGLDGSQHERSTYYDASGSPAMNNCCFPQSAISRINENLLSTLNESRSGHYGTRQQLPVFLSEPSRTNNPALIGRGHPMMMTNNNGIAPINGQASFNETTASSVNSGGFMRKPSMRRNISLESVQISGAFNHSNSTMPNQLIGGSAGQAERNNRTQSIRFSASPNRQLVDAPVQQLFPAHLAMSEKKANNKKKMPKE